MRIDSLETKHINAAIGLSNEANWNQTPQDWHLIIDDSTNYCYGGWVDGELVTTTTVVTYGDEVGWIGMVLVKKCHRQQGYGKQIFEYVLDDVHSKENMSLGLDATEAGIHIYKQFGFEEISKIRRWQGEVAPLGESQNVGPCEDKAQIQEIDREICGVDRSGLIELLLENEKTSGLIYEGSGEGYSILRPGRKYSHLGPLIGTNKEACRQLVSEAASRTDQLIIDSLDETMADIFSNHGLEPKRELTRMTQDGSKNLLLGEEIIGAAGFEFG